MGDVVDIRFARSYVATEEDRLIDKATVAHKLSVSESTIGNYVRGRYFKAGTWHKYENGPMPHRRLPGGQLRFNLPDCLNWLPVGENPLSSVESSEGE